MTQDRLVTELKAEGLWNYVETLQPLGMQGVKTLLMQDYAKFGVLDMEDKQRLFRLIRRLTGEDSGKSMSSAAQPDEKRRASAVRPAAEVSSHGSVTPTLLDKELLENNNLLDLDELDGSGDLLSAAGGASTLPFKLTPVRDTGVDMTRYLTTPPVPAGNKAPPKISVIVRKRPLNAQEADRGEFDVIQVDMDACQLIVNEPKVKVDLKQYTERHTFHFDAVFAEDVDNEVVYRRTVQPLLTPCLSGGKATCFAYGQTGSGKTYTMQPLPVRTAAELLQLLRLPQYQETRLFVSCFEIYGGKLYDLLNGRKHLVAREGRNKEICIVDLREYLVDCSELVDGLLQHAADSRTTGSTGANADSSRSHSIMQFSLKRVSSKGEPGKLVGKLTFIDLAGSERGADTYDNDRQTRLEGAEINKSLLALKECIRALDSDARHVPFRGSKLTEVLRDSFVGDEARTVMIANVSPNSASCEHTLNTLRYADRVKELRKEKGGRHNSMIANLIVHAGDAGAMAQPTMQHAQVSSGGRLRDGPADGAAAAWRSSPDGSSRRQPRTQTLQQSPPAAQNASVSDAHQSDQLDERLIPQREQLMTSILAEEDDLIRAHRDQIEDTMDLIRDEMTLLAEVDQPGSLIDSYVDKLEALLVRKAEGLTSLHSKLLAYQQKLRQEAEANFRAQSRQQPQRPGRATQ